MNNLKAALDYVRNFFSTPLEPRNGKRRATDTDDFLGTCKYRKVSAGGMSRDHQIAKTSSYNTNCRYAKDAWFRKPPLLFGRPKINHKLSNSNKLSFTKPRLQEVVVLDEDDDDLLIMPQNKNTSNKFTSTPFENRAKSKLVNGFDTDVTFLKHDTPFNFEKRPSLKLDSKIEYLDNSKNSRSAYASKLYRNANGLSSPKQNLSAKEKLIKVLDNFESDPIVIRDSESDDDVICRPPSPVPDIKVDPVNSIKKVIGFNEHSRSSWLDSLVDNHRKKLQERQKEVRELIESSEKHNKINRDIRLAQVTHKLNHSLSIKDAVIPVEDIKEELPDLTDEQQKLIDRAFRGNPNEILSSKFKLNISRRDLQTLHGLNWLNDEVINFYMNMIMERGEDSQWPKTYAFNTFFYSKIVKEGPGSVKRWTRRIDVFSYDIICVPVHLGMHWCMAIIDFRDKSIRYYDSMGSNNDRCLEALRDYLEFEYMDKKKAEYDTTDFIFENVKDIPQQMNGSDCGMFSCTFAEFITRNAAISFSQDDMPYLRRKMVLEILNGELLIK